MRSSFVPNTLAIWAFLCLYLSLITTGNCLPTTTPTSPSAAPAAGYLSVPLIPNTRAQTDGSKTPLHAAIIHQQHINHAVKRLALMTGRTLPTPYELLWNLHQRITGLSLSHSLSHSLAPGAQTNRTTYPSDLNLDLDLARIEAVLAGHFGVDVSDLSTGRVFQAMAAASARQRGEGANGGKGGMEGKGGAPLHTIGLDIESTDIGYIAQAQLGTPPRTFRLLVDSGSSDLWVGAEGCAGDDGGGCGNHTFLGPRTSTSYIPTNQTWATAYVSGAVEGRIVRDTVSIAGMTLRGHAFGVAGNESREFTSNDVPFDGILGLGKPDLAQQRGIPTLLQSLANASLIPHPIVSYKLPRLTDGPQHNSGEMTFGAMDPRHYDPRTLVTVPNVNKFGFWAANVSEVSIGGRGMGWKWRSVVMDTGTTLMIAPQADIDAIHKRIPGALKAQDGSWTVPCNMTTVISLTIGGQVFPIRPSDIAFWPVDSDEEEEGGSAMGMCMSGIAVGGVGPFYLATEWLVGDVFLKNVYFSTNEAADSISIAKPVH